MDGDFALKDRSQVRSHGGKGTLLTVWATVWSIRASRIRFLLPARFQQNETPEEFSFEENWYLLVRNVARIAVSILAENFSENRTRNRRETGVLWGCLRFARLVRFQLIETRYQMEQFEGNIAFIKWRVKKNLLRVRDSYQVNVEICIISCYILRSGWWDFRIKY